MFTHPHLTGQLARERQRDVLARADQRLIPHFRDLARGALGAPSGRRRMNSSLQRTRPAVLPS